MIGPTVSSTPRPCFQVWMILCLILITCEPVQAQNDPQGSDTDTATDELQYRIERISELRSEGDTTYYQDIPDLIAQAEEVGRSDLWILSLLEYGLYHELNDRLESADSLYSQALNRAKEKNLTRSVGEAYFYIGNRYRFSGSYQKALSYFDSAMTRYRQVGDSSQIASVLFSQGVIMDHLGDLRSSTDHFYAALDMASAIKDSIRMGNCHNSLGILHIRAKDYPTAESHYRKALHIMQRERQMKDMGNITDNIGEVLRLQGELDSALIYGEKALEIRRSIQDLYGLTRGLQNVSLTHIELQDYEQAEARLLEAKSILEERNDPHGLIGTLNRLATVYQYQGNSERSVASAEQALLLAQMTGSKYYEKSVQRNLSHIYEQNGRYREALSYYQAYDHLKDSLFNSENQTHLDELETRYRSAEKDKELAQQASSLALKDAALKRRNLWIALISGLSLLIVLSLWSRNQSIQQKRRLEKAEKEQLLAERKIGYAEAMLNGQERERGRIAKDLHDGLGALLATAKMHLSQVQEGIDQLEKLKVSKKAGELLDTAYAEVRRISHDMMPASLEKFGLEEALRSLVNNLKSTGMEAQLEGTLGSNRLLKDLEFALYRIAQEAANNTLKYAEAGRFTLRLDRSTETIQMQIEDDGLGFDSGDISSTGLGLDNMRSRAGFFDGHVDIESVPGQGTRITVSIPLEHG
ncbi:MAG: sensor histidine kinase [Flavobacteriales bacterium]|nr:sensor histidine kinase [Flavobacteriales bacterium]